MEYVSGKNTAPVTSPGALVAGESAKLQISECNVTFPAGKFQESTSERLHRDNPSALLTVNDYLYMDMLHRELHYTLQL